MTAVLFIYPNSLVYLRAYPEILLLDCMYKTNKYNMLLFDMIGVDTTGQSFYIVFTFLNDEADEDYMQVFERLKILYEQCGGVFLSVILIDRCLTIINTVLSIFLSTMCFYVWYANETVFARYQPAFQKAEEWSEFYGYWFSIFNSSVEEIYEERFKEFEKKYGSMNFEQVGYIKSIWLLLYKEKLVVAWVDQTAHFGNMVTFRVEGIYALFKSYFRRSTFDLFEMWKAIWLALNN